MDKILNKENAFFQKKSIGDITSAVMNDGPIIAESIGISDLMLILNIFQIIIIEAVLSYRNHLYGLIELIIGLMYFAILTIVNSKIRLYFKAFYQENANLTQEVNEDIRAIYEIKSLNVNDYFLNRFKDLSWNRYYPKAKRIVSVEVITGGINQFMSLLLPMIMFIIGVSFASKGKGSLGTAILLFVYTGKMIEPLNNLSDLYRGIKGALGVADRISEYLFDKEVNDNEKAIMNSDNPEIDIQIKKMEWENGRSILNNINCKYKAGDVVLLHGESGSGKTTLLKTMCGFIKNDNGKVSINSQEINKYDEKTIFEIIKMQFQEPVIISGTVYDNIALGVNYTKKEIEEAISFSGLKEYVNEVGLDYMLNANGSNLSGGQKQRIALARIIIRKPKILLLDELTNGLDSQVEDKILDNIAEYAKDNKAIVVISSHRKEVQRICNQDLAV
ncbi:ABC-type multidrug transport system, ATPase and permease components [Butyrivibrio fibrisolvens 16/4]|nr:ABC-type multidrug transport system, ATPase and permease components [Butyrivibrio fibrisolvens 16/4]